jgi:hypothetical protein
MKAPCGHDCPGCARRSADIDALTRKVEALSAMICGAYAAAGWELPAAAAPAPASRSGHLRLIPRGAA